MTSPNLIEKLRNFDAYPQTLEDYRIKSYAGVAVTFIYVCVVILLFTLEFSDYISPNVTEELFVDTSRSPSMNINLDIVFPTISCDFLALDAMDSSGEQHLQLQHQIFKRKLDLSGKPIEEPMKEDITNPTLKDKEVGNTTEKTCGSCYGAEYESTQCCNTCEEVKEAYRQRKWVLNPENITQCQMENYGDKLKNAFNEGCQIYGTLTVNRVGGSFHIAPGQSFSINHVHVHDVQPFSSTSFNTSHKINHLSFGRSISSTKTNPLDNTFVIANEGIVRSDELIQHVTET